MKLRSLCAATLVAAFGVAVVGTSTAEAAPNELASKGKVTVTEGTTDGNDGNKQDPEKPTEPIVDPGGEEITGNPDAGSLVIQVVSNMDFGSISRSTNAVVKEAKPVEIEGAVTDPVTGEVVLDANGNAQGDGVVRSRGQYVQWADLRKDTTSGYTLSAKMTQQFKETGGAELVGATIKYSNGIINSAAVGTWGQIDSTSFTLDDTNSVNVASATGAGVGKGVYFVEYGQSTDYKDISGTANPTDTTGKSVFLNVPAATASSVPTDVQYNAVVTWTLTAE